MVHVMLCRATLTEWCLLIAGDRRLGPKELECRTGLITTLHSDPDANVLQR